MGTDPRVRVQTYAIKGYLAVERLQVKRVERIGLVLLSAANQHTQLGLQPARTSDKMAGRAELFDSKMAR